MATDAMIGHGTRFLMGDGGATEVFTPIAEVVNITPANLSRDTPDATHMLSPNKYREFIPGLRDPGEVTLLVNFIPGGPGETAVLAAYHSDEMTNCRIEFPNGAVWNFGAYCNGYSPEVPLDDKMSATTTFKLSGQPTFIP